MAGGFEFLRAIKADHRWIATMVVSHDQTPQFLRHAVKCQIDGLLFKPVSSQEFLERWEAGALDDRLDFFEWVGLSRLAVKMGLLAKPPQHAPS